MLTTQTFVRVFAIDFSKAFDTVRLAVLIDKMARIAIPDAVYNIWINNFFVVTYTVQSTTASLRNWLTFWQVSSMSFWNRGILSRWPAVR